MTCENCRYHTATARAKVIDVADEDMEIVAFSDDEVEKDYTCMHPTQQGRAVGVGSSAGEGCPLFALGGKRSVDAELERRLAWREQRKDDPCGNE